MGSPRPAEPEILAYIEAVEGFFPDDAASAPVTQQRLWYVELCRAFDAPLPDGLAVSDDTASCPDGTVPLRRYRPAGASDRARVVYIHGGGFVVGSLDSHHSICAELAVAAGVELVAVDYRLAPEHRHPAALIDCLAAVRAVADRPLVLVGDSAGGNLAAGVALVLRDADRNVHAAQALLAAAGSPAECVLPAIAGQVPIYPGLGGDVLAGSYREMAEAPGLTTADVLYYRDILGAPAGDPYAHPLASADLSGLPPAYITAAHFDPLRDDGRHYAARLAAAGVDVAFREEPQMIHAWLRARHRSPGAGAGFTALCRGLQELVRRVAGD